MRRTWTFVKTTRERCALDRIVSRIGIPALAALCVLAFALVKARAQEPGAWPPICLSEQVAGALSALAKAPGVTIARGELYNNARQSISIGFGAPRLKARLDCFGDAGEKNVVEIVYTLEGVKVSDAQQRLMVEMSRLAFAASDAAASARIDALLKRCLAALPGQFDRNAERKAFPVYDSGLAAACKVLGNGDAETSIDISSSARSPQQDRWAAALRATGPDPDIIMGPGPGDERMDWRKLSEWLKRFKRGWERDRAMSKLLAVAAKDFSANHGQTLLGQTRCDPQRMFRAVRALRAAGLPLYWVGLDDDTMTIVADLDAAGRGIFALECLDGEPSALLWGLGGAVGADDPDAGPPPEPAKLTAQRLAAVASVVAADLKGQPAAFQAAFADCFRAGGERQLSAGALHIRCFDDTAEERPARLALTTGSRQ